MTYEEFLTQLMEEVQAYYKTAIIDLHHVLSANDTYRDAMLIRESENSNVSPALYLDDYYQDYLERAKEGGSVSDIARELIKNYQSYISNATFATQIGIQFQSEETIRTHVIFRLVGRDFNQKLLQDVPHRIIHDMAIIYYLTFYVDPEGELLLDDSVPTDQNPDKCMNASAMISNSHLALWKMTEEDLYTLAMENTPKLLPAEILDLYSLLRQMPEGVPASFLQNQDDKLCPMWILTNHRRHYGAASFLYPGVVAEFAKALDSDLYCLPSSIHEMILLPAECEQEHFQSSTLVAMVKEVNQAAVRPEERMTDNAYYYDRILGEFKPL